MIPRRIVLRGDSAVLQPWIDQVTQILTGGVALGDQVSTLVTATWNSDRMTPIALPSLTRPVAVLCLSAKSGSVTVSPAVIAWTWDSGSLTITSAPTLVSHVDYDLVLLAVKG